MMRHFLQNGSIYVDHSVLRRTSPIQSPLQVLHLSHWHLLLSAYLSVWPTPTIPLLYSRGMLVRSIFLACFQIIKPTESPLDSAANQAIPCFRRSLHVSPSGRTSLHHSSA